MFEVRGHHSYIPAEPFTMGSDVPDAPPDTKPEHTHDKPREWNDLCTPFPRL